MIRIRAVAPGSITTGGRSDHNRTQQTQGLVHPVVEGIVIQIDTRGVGIKGIGAAATRRDGSGIVAQTLHHKVMVTVMVTATATVMTMEIL